MNADATGGLILILIALACYFLPTVIATVRGKANGTTGVFFVNLCLGWTLIGWFIAFIWACSGETNAEVAKRDQQHRELLAAVAASGGKAVVVPPSPAASTGSLALIAVSLIVLLPVGWFFAMALGIVSP
jgi:hypothetical protein